MTDKTPEFEARKFTGVQATQESIDTDANPWLALSPLGAKQRYPSPQQERRGRFVKEEISPETAQAMRQFKEWLKQKETIGKAVFEVTMNRDALAKIVIPEPAGLPQGRPPNEPEIEDHEKTMDAYRELVALKERMLRLPEKLQFQPGITLIVGENGAGKTILSKALSLKAQVAEATVRDRINASYRERGNEFEHAGEVRYQMIFEPRKVDYQSAWLKQAGLAPDVAKAMDVDNFYTSIQSGTSIEYDDFPEIIGRQRGLDEKYALTEQVSGQFTGYKDKFEYDQFRSHRQTVDKQTLKEFKRRNGWNKGPKIYFFDEPETGMSPRRHLDLEQEVASFMTAGSIAIVPTNSVVLFNSDLPRIDLDFPERGIHKPSDYSESAVV